MQQSILNINLSISGQPVFVHNSVNIQSGGTLKAAYAVKGAPATLTVTVQGVKNATGDQIVLDSYTGTADTTRSISLTDTYDSFLVTAVWTGGTSSVGVNATISSTGAGSGFTGGAPGQILVGAGSPANVIAAPIGTLYVNTNGGSNTTLYVKESGSDASGWTGK